MSSDNRSAGFGFPTATEQSTPQALPATALRLRVPERRPGGVQMGHRDGWLRVCEVTNGRIDGQHGEMAAVWVILQQGTPDQGLSEWLKPLQPFLPGSASSRSRGARCFSSPALRFLPLPSLPYESAVQTSHGPEPQRNQLLF
jgi:hypothetical protein